MPQNAVGNRFRQNIGQGNALKTAGDARKDLTGVFYDGQRYSLYKICGTRISCFADSDGDLCAVGRLFLVGGAFPEDLINAFSGDKLTKSDRALVGGQLVGVSVKGEHLAVGIIEF